MTITALIVAALDFFFVILSGVGTGYGIGTILNAIVQLPTISYGLGIGTGIALTAVFVLRIYTQASEKIAEGSPYRWWHSWTDPYCVIIRLFGMYGNASLFYAGIVYLESTQQATTRIAEFNEARYNQHLESAQEYDRELSHDMQQQMERTIMRRGYLLTAARRDSLRQAAQQREDILADHYIASIQPEAVAMDNFALLGYLAESFRFNRVLALVVLTGFMPVLFDSALDILTKVLALIIGPLSLSQTLVPLSGTNGTAVPGHVPLSPGTKNSGFFGGEGELESEKEFEIVKMLKDTDLTYREIGSMDHIRKGKSTVERVNKKYGIRT